MAHLRRPTERNHRLNHEIDSTRIIGSRERERGEMGLIRVNQNREETYSSARPF